MSLAGTSDGLSSATQPSGFQSSWLGVPGHVSMADIVKMGRPHGKASTVSNSHIHSNVLATSDHSSKVVDIHGEPGIAVNQHLSANDDWPAIEQPPVATLSSVVEAPSDSDPYADPSISPMDRGNQHTKFQLDEIEVAEDLPGEMLNANHVGPASVSSRSMQEDNSGGASVFDNSSYMDMNSYQPHRHALEHSEGDNHDISIAFPYHFPFIYIFLRDLFAAF